MVFGSGNSQSVTGTRSRIDSSQALMLIERHDAAIRELQRTVTVDCLGKLSQIQTEFADLKTIAEKLHELGGRMKVRDATCENMIKNVRNDLKEVSALSARVAANEANIENIITRMKDIDEKIDEVEKATDACTSKIELVYQSKTIIFGVFAAVASVVTFFLAVKDSLFK